jgi:predicted DNA-binding transcriptional regulator YafY
MLGLPILSEQESLLLILAEQQLQCLLPSKLMKSLDFFVQARANLAPHENAKQASEWLSKVRVIQPTQPLLAPEIKVGVFEEVSNALYANHWLEIEYQSVKGKKTKAKVMPLGLAQQGTGLYLVCRFEGFDDERILAVHRILVAKATQFIFEKPANFSMKKYDLEGHFGFGDGKRIKLKFKIEKLSGEHLLEMRLSEDQVTKDLGEYYEITATVVDTKRLDWWLLGFGERVKGIRKTEIAIGKT